MRRALAALAILALLFVSGPVEAILRAKAPPRLLGTRIGAGRLMSSVLTGAFRPLLSTYLFLRADTLYGHGRFDELHRHYRLILSLYPNNIRAREFLGWHLAFNLRNEAPSRELAWRWAREGLDILAETHGGRREIAYWCLAQCGQNSLDPVYPMRYAGPDLERERWWRERLSEWAQRRYAKPGMSRFEVGLEALDGQRGIFDLVWRAALATRMVYDAWARTGRCPDFDRARAALVEYAEAISDNPDLARLVRDDIAELDSIRAGRPRAVAPRPFPRAYRVAMAVLGIGRRTKNTALVQAAREALQRLDQAMNPDVTFFAEEIASAR